MGGSLGRWQFVEVVMGGSLGRQFGEVVMGGRLTTSLSAISVWHIPSVGYMGDGFRRWLWEVVMGGPYVFMGGGYVRCLSEVFSGGGYRRWLSEVAE